MYRMHIILTFKDYICSTYTEFNYFTNDIIDIVEMKSEIIRKANFEFTYLFKNTDTIKNSYLYALSIVNNKPEFHVFIVSEIVSWISKIDLCSISNETFTVKDKESIVALIPEDNVVIIKGYHQDQYKKEQVVYYFYNFTGPNIANFDKVSSTDTQFSVSKFIYISEFLYYIIYYDACFVDLYKLNTK